MDMSNSKFIKTFESFSKEGFDEIVKQDKTYVKYAPIDKTKQYANIGYEDIIEDIRNYDINRFHIYIESFAIIITPDTNFIYLLNELNKYLVTKIDLNIKFYLSVDTNRNNVIDFEYGVPHQLRNLSIGFKIYKLILSKFFWITTKTGASQQAYNLWYNLFQDKEVYGFTSKLISGIILKNINNDTLSSILDEIKKINIDFIFDPELEQKITELYGTLHIYKQRN